MNISEFKQLEVVNICDGKILGTVSDFYIDLSEGEIEAIIVPGMNKIVNLFSKDEYVIPWSDIKKIGKEVILVAHNEKRRMQE